MLDRQTRDELSALSKEVFGASSRWQKLVNNGYQELITQDVEETIPAEKEGEEPTVQTVKKPVLTASGARQYTLKRHTPESVRQIMVELKDKRDAFNAMRTKLLAEQKAAQEAAEAQDKLNREVHTALSGSAAV